jgi:hypothetical protein
LNENIRYQTSGVRRGIGARIAACVPASIVTKRSRYAMKCKFSVFAKDASSEVMARM